jgi:hypothetical protein
MESKDSNPTAQKKSPVVKICCACPDQKKVRDYCFLVNGPADCKKELEKYYVCDYCAFLKQLIN